MRIEIAWSDNAIALLNGIYNYYYKKSPTAAIRLYNNILDSAEPLRTFPNAGPVEPLLEEYEDGFRSIVAEKHYKLIYTVKEELVEIHAVWDCRQEGWRLKEMFK
ncbi:type II toxin-antitoxin system RelE/ParE family toxin [Parabacteroides sp. AF17-28]|jgi:plasmid stabilization system protein ParE|uniref:type II toxin-antitoxin system RelE/ParE family toxin n=1 Tax=Parabacteroides sp. AF17-28 TaxID=2292241 RepID=UPI000EFED377|nr:type II toxin-antitoxin system RelE/ParE family toxin [Parabacteroides sp. AF17-28]RHR59804.1 type II toxin-antitoxin system RelE/ParE family toxin [Parabacteroides sp. AF17-28]